MNKIIVWDLFGGGQNSVYKTIQEHAELKDLFSVYTFDITQPYHNQQYEVNLAQENIVEVFKNMNIPAPDIITASPLCQSFSTVLQMTGGGHPFELITPIRPY